MALILGIGIIAMVEKNIKLVYYLCCDSILSTQFFYRKIKKLYFEEINGDEAYGKI